MHEGRPIDIPELRAGLHLLGWSTADARGMAQDGSTWFVVFAERDGQRLRGEGPTEAAAWAEIGWKALDDPDRGRSGLPYDGTWASIYPRRVPEDRGTRPGRGPVEGGRIASCSTP